MLFDYEEKEQIKNEDGSIKYFKQTKPFTNGFICCSGLVSIRPFGRSQVFYYSKDTKSFLGSSDTSTMSLFEEVKEDEESK